MDTDADRGALSGFRRLVNATIGATFALIVVGGVVRVSDSGLGCGPAGSGTEGWPLCGGRLVPFVETSAMIEYSHRLLAALVGVAMLAIAWQALRRLRGHPWLVRGSLAGAVLVLLQGGLGGLTVENNLDEVLVAAHLALAMLLLAVLLGLSWASRPEPHPRAARGLRPLAVAASALALAAIVSGGYMAGTQRYGTSEYALGDGAHLACGKEFPGCNGSFMPFGEARLVDIHLSHRLFVYLTVLGTLALIALALRQGAATRATRAAGVVLAAQVAAGALNVWLGEHEELIVAHLALGTLLWASLVAATLELLPAPRPAGRRLRPSEPDTPALPA